MQNLLSRLMILVTVLWLSFLAGAGCVSPNQNGSVPKTREFNPYRFTKDKNSYTILAFGDFGQPNADGPGSPQKLAGQAMAQVCQSRKCDFALGLGDNFYPAGVRSAHDRIFYSRFEEPYSKLQFPFFMSLGNHDYGGNVEAQLEYRSERWNMPAKFYSIPDLPPWLTLFAMDTNRMDADQLAKIETTLCGAPSDGWKIVFGHHPVYSDGGHGNTDALVADLVPVIQKCGIQLVVSGHDHDLESITSPIFDQVISGAAGAASRVRKVLPHENIVQNFSYSDLGFAVLNITRDSMTVSFYGLDEKPLFEYEVSGPQRPTQSI